MVLSPQLNILLLVSKSNISIYFEFLLIKRISWKNFGLRHVLLFVILFPASEKRRSLGTEVAGIDKYLCANIDNTGNLCLFLFHHLKGLVLGFANSVH